MQEIVFSDRRVTLPYQSAITVVPYHDIGYEQNKSSESDDEIQSINKENNEKYRKNGESRESSGTNKCVDTNKKILAASITYKDLNILESIGGERIRYVFIVLNKNVTITSK